MFFDMGSAGKRSELKEYYDMVIVGGGPGGIAAAIYAVQGGIKPLIIEKALDGGQINLTERIENYPGFPSIEGSVLAEKFGEHAKNFGVEFNYSTVTKIEDKGEEKLIHIDDGSVIKTKVVIIATGANPRPAGVKGEKEFTNKGISYCATCDGHFFKDQKVAVIGGGNAAVEEALYLAKIAKEVVIIHRRDKLRADKIYQERAFNTPNINFRWDSVVDEIKGDVKVRSLVLRNKKTNELTEEDFDGVFVFIGLEPTVDFLNGLVELNESKYIKTDKHMQTNVKGIYAVGDVIEKELRQVVTSVAEGAIAASHAVREYFN